MPPWAVCWICPGNTAGIYARDRKGGNSIYIIAFRWRIEPLKIYGMATGIFWRTIELCFVDARNALVLGSLLRLSFGGVDTVFGPDSAGREDHREQTADAKNKSPSSSRTAAFWL